MEAKKDTAAQGTTPSDDKKTAKPERQNAQAGSAKTEASAKAAVSAKPETPVKSAASAKAETPAKTAASAKTAAPVKAETPVKKDANSKPAAAGKASAPAPAKNAGNAGDAKTDGSKKPAASAAPGKASASSKSPATPAAAASVAGKEASSPAQEEKKGAPLLSKIFSILLLILLAGCIAMAVRLYQDTISRRELHNAEVRAAQEISKAQEGEPEAAEVSQEEHAAAVPIEEASFYQKIHDGEPVRVLVLGDNFATGSSASSEEQGWPYLFMTKLREEYGAEVALSNMALMGGNTAYSGYVQLQNVPVEETPDLCIVSFGYYDDVFTYNLFYEALLRALDGRFPGCGLISVIESAAVTHMEGNADETARYTRQLCEHYHGIVANMAEAYADDARPYETLSTEYALPNDAGQEIYAEWLMGCIRPEAEAYSPKREAQPEPMDQNVLGFADFTYIPAELFQKLDAFSYRIRKADLEQLGAVQSGLLGLDYDYQPGRNNVNVRIDREIFAGHAEEFEGERAERHIRIMGNHAVVSEDLIISFEDAIQAEGFHGVALSGDITFNEDEEEIEELPMPEIQEEEETEEAEETEGAGKRNS